MIDSVAACIGAEPDGEQAFFTALLIWQQLHGIVSLRISRPRFPWPPLAETVAEAVDRLLAAARRLLAPAASVLLSSERNVAPASGIHHARTGRCWQQQSCLPQGTTRTPASTTHPHSAQLTFMVQIVTAAGPLPRPAG